MILEDVLNLALGYQCVNLEVMGNTEAKVVPGWNNDLPGTHCHRVYSSALQLAMPSWEHYCVFTA